VLLLLLPKKSSRHSMEIWYASAAMLLLLQVGGLLDHPNGRHYATGRLRVGSLGGCDEAVCK
jgi:hypothetical protein